MNREEYLRELEAAGFEMSVTGRELVEAANPLTLLRASVSRDWKWWLTGALAAGILAAQFVHRPRRREAPADHHTGAPSGGAAFWVPTMIKLLPAAAVQLVPLFLSLRKTHKE